MQYSVVNIQPLKRMYLFTFLITFCVFNFSFAQYEIPEKPKQLKEQKGVYDYIELLNFNDSLNLERKLIRYSDTTSTQIVVAIINSTKGENIDYLGTQWAHKWGIGQAKEDNGVFILLAKGDRKIAIKTGYGVEHLLTDALSRRIIENDIIPYFKQNNYYGGLNRGTDAIFEVLNGEYQGTRRQSNTSEFPAGFIIILVFIFIIIIISISKNRHGGGGNGRNRGNKSQGLDILEAIILSNMGRGSYRRSGGFGGFGGSSSSGGSFGGGGFGGGFGGGGFGGGGASGGW